MLIFSLFGCVVLWNLKNNSPFPFLATQECIISCLENVIYMLKNLDSIFIGEYIVCFTA